MFSNRLAQQSLRRLAIQHPAAWRSSVSKFAKPAAIATGNYAQIRPATTSIPAANDTIDPTQILAKQRLNRPVAPHITIYQPQLTWYLSAFNRITGCLVSGGLYIFASAYLVSPLLGWHLESASLAAAFGALPLAAKFSLKLGVAFPFAFHCMNGIRHLVWDLGKQITNKQVITTAWTVLGLSSVASLVLALM
ncbi:hypothetical protein FQN57_007273 [Myotisia sp. PD_48]|nr:hypothetical protein FQN57_007273 [Myotisia sp. PD_48]